MQANLGTNIPKNIINSFTIRSLTASRNSKTSPLGVWGNRQPAATPRIGFLTLLLALMLTFTRSSTARIATVRTLTVWLLSNLGGTTWLLLDFCRDSPEDFGIPLVVGLMAALLSLATVPLAIPVFALAQRQCTNWRCRLLVLAAVLLVFALGNFVLLRLLPIGPASSLLCFSWPYLGTALLAALWIYRPQTVRQLRSAPLLLTWQPRPTRSPVLA